MSNPNFDLLNVFPIITRNHTAQELGIVETGNKPIRIIRTFHNMHDIVRESIEHEGLSEADYAFEEALDISTIYRRWQELMPFLKDVPNIHDFRNKPKHKNNVKLVDTEILQYGGYLSKGQILYRGGNFQPANMTRIQFLSATPNGGLV